MDEQRVIERLEANAEAIAALASGVPPEQAVWRPSPEAWSMLEVVCHLLDEEREDFRARIDLVVYRPGEIWPPIDPPGWVVDRAYATRDLDEVCQAFVAERARSAGWLRTLTAPDWDAAYEHPLLGRLRAGDLLAAWLAHDLLHIRQLTRLHWEHHRRHSAPFEVAYAGSW